MAYAAASDYVEFAHIKTFDSDVDELRWTNFIARAKVLIDNHCRRTFEAATDGVIGDSDSPVTRYFDYSEDVQGDILYLDKDLVEVSSIKYGDSDGTTLSAGQYITLPRNETPINSIKILGSANINWTYDSDVENGIEVAGIWAYSKTAPADITWATLRLVDWMEKIRTSNPDLDRPALAGDGTVLLPTRLPADVVAILNTYKRMRLIA